MLAVLFGAASAVFFGAADFIGGLAARRVTAMLVTGLAATAGVIALTIAAPFDGGVWHTETWVGGIATGVASCLGIWLLYSAYAVGPMTTLAPIVAIVSTIVPMVAGLITGETFSALGWAAVIVGLAAIILVAAAPDARTSRARPIDMVKAGIAGALLGVFYIYLDSSAEDSGLTPLTANRIACAIVAFLIVGVLMLRARATGDARRALRPADPAVASAGTRAGAVEQVEASGVEAGIEAGGVAVATRPGVAARIIPLAAVGLAALSGTFDATANALFTAGLAVGDLAVLSVVSGFYPAVTIALAFVVLRERPNRLQGLGIVLALVSLVGMSLA